MPLAILNRKHPLFPDAETLIETVFACEYGAVISHLPDRILAVLDDNDGVLCAAGLRDSVSGIFSECYLDRAVEQAIEEKAGKAVHRDQILELTALAAVRPGAMALLLRGFAEIGLEAGYRWGLFTATARLRRMARRIGIELIELADASRDQVSDPDCWGNYYDQNPAVCAVEGRPAQGRLKSGLLTPCGAKERLPVK